MKQLPVTTLDVARCMIFRFPGPTTRGLVVACVLSCLSQAASAQANAPPKSSSAAGAPIVKPVAKKPTPKAKTATTPEGPESGPCRIGVIPAIDEQFVVEKIGFTIFGYGESKVPVDSWGLNDLVVARVRAAAGPGGAVRKIAYAKDAFGPVDRPGTLFRDAKAELRNAVRQVATTSHCDRYVLVQSATSQFSNLTLSVHGVGIVNWYNPIKDHTYLFALTHIGVYDGQSFELIRDAAASADEQSIVSRVLLLEPIRGPSRPLDNALFPSAPPEAATNPVFRDGVRALLTASLDKTLPGLLGP